MAAVGAASTTRSSSHVCWIVRILFLEGLRFHQSGPIVNDGDFVWRIDGPASSFNIRQNTIRYRRQAPSTLGDAASRDGRRGWWLRKQERLAVRCDRIAMIGSSDGIMRTVEQIRIAELSLIHISEPTRLLSISYAV